MSRPSLTARSLSDNNDSDVKRKFRTLKMVPGWVAILLTTSARLPDLDKQITTRIMGLGYKCPECPCTYPDAQHKELERTFGTFYYIADSDADHLYDPRETIWNVLSEILAGPALAETLKDIERHNGRNANH